MILQFILVSLVFTIFGAIIGSNGDSLNKTIAILVFSCFIIIGYFLHI